MGVHELEHRAGVVCPAVECRAEEVPGGVGNQTGPGASPLVPLQSLSNVVKE